MTCHSISIDALKQHKTLRGAIKLYTAAASGNINSIQSAAGLQGLLSGLTAAALQGLLVLIPVLKARHFRVGGGALPVYDGVGPPPSAGQQASVNLPACCIDFFLRALHRKS